MLTVEGRGQGKEISICKVILMRFGIYMTIHMMGEYVLLYSCALSMKFPFQVSLLNSVIAIN